MSILSEEIPTFRPIKEQYFVGCYINDITAVIGGPDEMPEHKYETKEICNRLCHQIIDGMGEWGIGLIDPEDLRPIVNVYMKVPTDYYIEREAYGQDIYLTIHSKPTNGNSSKTIVKIVLTAKEWYC